jgi:uracil-DNA glycosylase
VIPGAGTKVHETGIPWNNASGDRLVANWRTTCWQKRNAWFEVELLPELRKRVGPVLG